MKKLLFVFFLCSYLNLFSEMPTMEIERASKTEIEVIVNKVIPHIELIDIQKLHSSNRTFVGILSWYMNKPLVAYYLLESSGELTPLTDYSKVLLKKKYRKEIKANLAKSLEVSVLYAFFSEY